MECNIVLCGFMASGKSSVAKRLAKKLDTRYVDTDTLVERKLGMNTIDIFSKLGEDVFRRTETEVIHELSGERGLVIACGGGTVLRKENVDAFHSGGGKIIYLDVPLAALQERLKNDKKRPLLQVPDRRKVIEELYTARGPLYKAAADYTVPAGAPAIVVVKRIMELGLE